MKKKLSFRAWSYFRVGYAQYFSFILALANMFTLTYYLAIKDNTFFTTLFPNFSTYVVVSSFIGIPLLALVGYVHIHKSHAYTADMDISAEAYPYNYKLGPGIQKECMAPLYLGLLRLGRKSLSAEKLSEDELQELKKLEKNLDLISKGDSLPIPKKFDEIK